MDSDALILVYACNSAKSLESLQYLYQRYIMEICKENGKNMCMVLVMNKTDLTETEYEVTYHMGKNVAASWNMPFIDTSAKTGVNVQEAFGLLVRTMDGQIEQDQVIMSDQTDGCRCKLL